MRNLGTAFSRSAGWTAAMRSSVRQVKLPPDMPLAPLIPISIDFLRPVLPQSLIHSFPKCAVMDVSHSVIPMAGFTPSQTPVPPAGHGKVQHSTERISLWRHLGSFSSRNSSPVLSILASPEWPVQGAVSSEPQLSLCAHSDWPFITQLSKDHF